MTLPPPCQFSLSLSLSLSLYVSIYLSFFLSFRKIKSGELIKAKDLKPGTCLKTVHGDKFVSATTKVPSAEAKKHETFSIVTAGGKQDLVAVGGVVSS